MLTNLDMIRPVEILEHKKISGIKNKKRCGKMSSGELEIEFICSHYSNQV